MRGLAVIAAMTAGFPAAAQNLSAQDVNLLPSSPPTLIARYGADPLQMGELRLPAGDGPFPVVVVIHGGCWTKGYATLRNTAALASALTDRGYATWNIEYRQVGDAGGGWPGTFTDWAAAVDHLRVLATTEPLSLSRIGVVGHSAGAHAALWIASRSRLPATSQIAGDDSLPVAAAVAIDGPGDLRALVGPDADICGRPVVAPFIGGAPDERPERYVEASPIENLPFNVRQYLVASDALTLESADAYRARAAAAGERVEVLELPNGGHFDVIAPGSDSWAKVEPFLLRALGSE